MCDRVPDADVNDNAAIITRPAASNVRVKVAAAGGTDEAPIATVLAGSLPREDGRRARDTGPSSSRRCRSRGPLTTKPAFRRGGVLSFVHVGRTTDVQASGPEGNPWDSFRCRLRRGAVFVMSDAGRAGQQSDVNLPAEYVDRTKERFVRIGGGAPLCSTNEPNDLRFRAIDRSIHLPSINRCGPACRVSAVEGQLRALLLGNSCASRLIWLSPRGPPPRPTYLPRAPGSRDRW